MKLFIMLGLLLCVLGWQRFDSRRSHVLQQTFHAACYWSAVWLGECQERLQGGPSCRQHASVRMTHHTL